MWSDDDDPVMVGCGWAMIAVFAGVILILVIGAIQTGFVSGTIPGPVAELAGYLLVIIGSIAVGMAFWQRPRLIAWLNTDRQSEDHFV